MPADLDGMRPDVVAALRLRAEQGRLADPQRVAAALAAEVQRLTAALATARSDGAARSDVPALVAEVRRLHSALAAGVPAGAQERLAVVRVASNGTAVHILGADGRDPTGDLYSAAAKAVGIAAAETGAPPPYCTSDGDVWLDTESRGTEPWCAAGIVVRVLLQAGFVARVELEPVAEGDAP